MPVIKLDILKKEEEEWQDSTGDLWRPEKQGDFVVGKLISSRAGRYQWKNYTIEASDGKVKTIFGSAVLENRMSAVKEGQDVKIVFEGMQKNTKGQNMRMYRVLVKKGG